MWLRKNLISVQMHFLFVTVVSVKSQDSSVGRATGQDFFLLHSVKTGSELFSEDGCFEFRPGRPLSNPDWEVSWFPQSLQENVGLVSLMTS
jgi:hypothetical protein